jgi:predicted permease
MEDRTLRFLVFVAFSLLCLAAGYVARKRGWAQSHWSKPMHHFTLVWLWSPVMLLAFWGLPSDEQSHADLTLLLLAQPVVMMATGGVALLMAIIMRRPRIERGPIILIASLSNHGFTLGAYLCYALLEPGDVAMRYGIAYVASMQVFMVLLLYPVAYHYGPHRGSSLGRIMFESFFTLKAMPLHMAVAGLALNIWGVKIPEFFDKSGFMDLMFFLGAAGSYGGIGLLVRFGDTRRALPLHVIGAISQFVVFPLMTVGLLWLLHRACVPMSALPQNVMLIESFTPAGLNSVMVANLFHLDARLSSVLWVCNTLFFCAVVLPLVLWAWG